MNDSTEQTQALPYLVEAVYLSCTVCGDDCDEAFAEREAAWERAVLVLWIGEAV